MRMNWFRVYHDARNDAKLRTLSDSQFRVWFNLLCLASEQLDRGLIDCIPTDLLSVEVAGGDDELLSNTLRQLERLRIIEVKRDVTPCNAGENDVRVTCVTCAFLHFMERQYDKPSDFPEAVRERVIKTRNTHKNEVVTPSNAMKRDVTPIQEKIRDEEIREEKTGARAKAARSLPSDFAITDAMRLWAKKNTPGLDILAATEEWKDAMRSNTTKYKYTDWEAAWHNGMKRAQQWGGNNGNGTNRQSAQEVSPEERAQQFRPGFRELLEKRISGSGGS